MGRFNILLFLVIFILGNLVSMVMIWSIPYEDSIDFVKCYDRYGNEIIGLECEEEIVGLDLSLKIFISFVMELIIISLVLAMSKKYEPRLL